MTQAPRFDDAMLLVTTDGLGDAPQELSQKVLARYLDVIAENGTPPGVVAFYTRGVLLTVEGSPVLERLQALERRGARLIVCKTCVDHFGVAERVRAGVVGGMGDILAAQILAKKVITV
jgi:hypothetical protein